MTPEMSCRVFVRQITLATCDTQCISIIVIYYRVVCTQSVIIMT